MINLFDEAEFETALEGCKNHIPLFKSTIKTARQRLMASFDESIPIDQLIHGLSHCTDAILTYAWKLKISDQQPSEIALIAVGGYGRGELHPNSDVDILILLNENCGEKYNSTISDFITFLWDIGLEIGSSVRTLEECVNEAKNDITIATNIVESRLIYGPDALYEELSNETGPDKIWPSPLFFEGKWKEQIKRHNRFHNTAYNLEPNVKESPGGLRDIQMIGWIAKRHFGELDLRKLVDYDFLTENELHDLLNIQNFFWKVRFALHSITGRREDRLLFEHQRVIAEKLNFIDENQEVTFDKCTDRPADGKRLAVELFMKQYYRNAMELSRLNEMLLQHYQEVILGDDDNNTIKIINDEFQINRGFIEARSESTFKERPSALFEIFLLKQSNPKVKGIRASSIRLIHESLYLIDDQFRNDQHCKNLFIILFKQPTGLTDTLRKMNTYGILTTYLPAFGKIVGQMQFDLFHIYTVDQHTLFVVRNLRRFFCSEYEHEFPLASKIIRDLPKPELLYIAGLFHDIGKGRGGDHSRLGEIDARLFCEQHGFNKYDTELVGWLVRHHLMMSSTAQHKDLSDPEVIFHFAQKTDNNIKLDYLYLLTVADMRATNDKVWNSWKDSLLKALRQQTKLAFMRGLENPIGEAEKIEQTKQEALEKIISSGYNNEKTITLWGTLGKDYFLRYSAVEIAQYSQAILDNPNEDSIIYVRSEGFSGGTDIFLKTPIKSNLFANSSAALDSLRLNVVEAKIVSSTDKNALNTYSVLEYDGNIVTDEQRLIEIKQTLFQYIKKEGHQQNQNFPKTPRKIECFIKPTEITFVDNETTGRTTLEIITTDRRGLLALIAQALMQQNIRVNNAKIATLGAQVDDIFYVRDSISGSCITESQKNNIKQDLLNLLDCK